MEHFVEVSCKTSVFYFLFTKIGAEWSENWNSLHATSTKDYNQGSTNPVSQKLPSVDAMFSLAEMKGI